MFKRGTASDDQLIGSADSDLLRGNGGDDALTGGEGDDILFGESGDDVLLAGDGVDVLVGGRGRDQINGGLDGDVLTGGRGRDTFHFEIDDQVLYTALPYRPDVITDFRPGRDAIVIAGNVSDIRYNPTSGDVTADVHIGAATANDIVIVRLDPFLDLTL